MGLTLCFCLRHRSHALLTRVGCLRVELIIEVGCKGGSIDYLDYAFFPLQFIRDQFGICSDIVCVFMVSTTTTLLRGWPPMISLST
jgi:hypothetical protein